MFRMSRFCSFAALSCALLFGSVASAVPTSLATPAGLNPGDTFRFLFLTAGTQSGTSTDVNTYNTFVNGQAAGATYQGSVISWKAVASTASVDARDNIGGFNTNVPVYLTSGVLLAGNLSTGTSARGLWSGSLFTTPTIGIDGNIVNTRFAYTGSKKDGTGFPDNQLGSTVGSPATQYGDPTANIAALGWFFDLNTNPNSIPLNFYGVSSELTVSAVPEPSTYASLLAGLAFGGFSMWRRRTRA